MTVTHPDDRREQLDKELRPGVAEFSLLGKNVVMRNFLE